MARAMNLDVLGWSDHFDRALEEANERAGTKLVAARVAADFGKDLRVVGPFGEERAALAGRLRFEEGLRPAVGDFVGLVGESESMTIVEVLERRTALVRQAAGQKTGRQIVGANLDIVFIVTSFNEDLSLNRLERYVVAVREGGATPIVLVNKEDLVTPEERDALLDQLNERLAEIEVRAVSAQSEDGLAGLRERVGFGVTASFVGSSGVGKSSIVNRLVGTDLQAVREVRESDAKGRHTTTHRELFVLQGGGMLLDTPGMREFQLWDEVVADAFEDVAALAETCRFRDCQHEAEPGCAVVEAVGSGALDPGRLESFRKLAREVASQAVRQDEALRRSRGKELKRAIREVQKVKKGEPE